MPRYIDPDERRLYRAVIAKTVAANRFSPERSYVFVEGPYTTAGQARSRLTHHERRAARSWDSQYHRFTVSGWIEGADAEWQPLD